MEHETHTTHTKKQPSVALQVMGFLFGLMGLAHFIIGIPLILLLGFGLIVMAIGAAEMYLGMQIYYGKKSAYVPALVVGVLAVFSSFSLYRGSGLIPAIFLAVLYVYRDEFVN